MRNGRTYHIFVQFSKEKKLQTALDDTKLQDVVFKRGEIVLYWQ